MSKENNTDKTNDNSIIIYDNSGDKFEVLKNIIFISSDGKQKYRIIATKNRKYSMQK